MQNGEILNNTYEVLRALDQGAAGQVYLAWHMNLGKYVVIKKIKERFVGKINERQEADILKRLHHGHIPQVYDFVQMGQEVYTVIDYVDGVTLHECIERGDFFPEAEIIRLMRQMLDALAYLHNQNPPVIHNDIKPANIMIRNDGDLCLIDFNISFGEYEEKDMKGYSVGFASPEQEYRMQLYRKRGNYRDIQIDGRSDLFSMGASFYYLMTGEYASHRLKNRLPLWDPNVDYPYSEQLREIIARVLQIRPEDRFASAEDVLSEINNMKRKDKALRKAAVGQTIFSLFFTALTAVGIIAGVLGYQIRLEEQFYDDAQKAVKLYDACRYDAAADLAEEILNEPKYKKAMKNDSGETAKMMYIIGDSCFRREEYQDASKFFEMAAHTDRDEGRYYHEWAISLVNLKKHDEAEQVLEEAESYGVEQSNLSLVKGEIELGNHDYEEAAKILEKTIRSSDSDEITALAAIGLAEAKVGAGDLNGALDVLEDIKDELEGKERRRVLSSLGTLYIKALSPNDSAISEYAGDAEKVFEELTKNPEEMQVEDWMNLVDLKNMQKKYSEAEAILKDIRKDNSMDYRISMQQAKTELYIQSAKSENQDYSKVEAYYNEAEKLYPDDKRNGDPDPRMLNLEEHIKLLKDAGWLQ